MSCGIARLWPESKGEECNILIQFIMKHYIFIGSKTDIQSIDWESSFTNKKYKVNIFKITEAIKNIK